MITETNINVVPVLADAGAELSQLESIEIAPLPESGIELLNTGSDVPWEHDWKKSRLYLCQQGTGYFCEITGDLEDGRIGLRIETLSPGPEEIYIAPEPFCADGINDDEAVVLIEEYAEEEHTGAMRYGTRIVIYTSR